MTADEEHHRVIKGRSWRTSDPTIPERLRQELVDALMAARRAVRDRGDAARPGVQDAKVALGERGERWWETTTSAGRVDRLACAGRALLRQRAGVVPVSELAEIVSHRSPDPDGEARAAAARLCAEGSAVADAGDPSSLGPGPRLHA